MQQFSYKNDNVQCTYNGLLLKFLLKESIVLCKMESSFVEPEERAAQKII